MTKIPKSEYLRCVQLFYSLSPPVVKQFFLPSLLTGSTIELHGQIATDNGFDSVLH